MLFCCMRIQSSNYKPTIIRKMKTTDEKLRKIAIKRVEFKRHLRTYLLVTVGLWIYWYLSRAQFGKHDGFWPIWVSLGWGIGIVSHYFKVYNSHSTAVEKEFQKLKQEQDNSL